MAEPKPPSPPWVGGVSTALMGLVVVVLLTYTLLDWQWQQSLGAWNYAAVGVLVVGSSVLMKHWRADLSRNDAAGEPVDEGRSRDDAAGEPVDERQR